ncbi:MAG: pyridoxamine 5'-phosphate oxidase family protein [Tannerellaceae bacterium]|nr:pyridoxamine 5'-phosphate oxidase family protein [Tannerellaceae bacterium]
MREIRRKDRMMDPEEAYSLLLSGEYGFLAMVNADGGGYGIPFSYVWDGKQTIYFHCAPEGHKLENLAKENRVTFTVVGATQLLPEKFATAYQSVMAFGEITRELPEEEGKTALRLLVEKYSPDHKQSGEKYIQGAFHKTVILKMHIHHITGKKK